MNNSNLIGLVILSISITFITYPLINSDRLNYANTNIAKPRVLEHYCVKPIIETPNGTNFYKLYDIKVGNRYVEIQYDSLSKKTKWIKNNKLWMIFDSSYHVICIN